MPVRALNNPVDSRPQTLLGDSDWAGIAENLLHFAAALTGSRHEAEDLVQQTIAALLAKRRESVDHRGLARVTLTRLWLTRQRAHRRLLARLKKLATGGPGRDTSMDRVELDEQAGLARAAMDQLPPRQRAALMLRVVGELPYEAIAEALSCDVQAVRSNLHLARARVRVMLGGEP